MYGTAPVATHLLIYDYVEDMLERRTPVREAHLAHVGAQRRTGTISVAGPFDPPTGAVLVFEDTDRDAVEAFVAADPYYSSGLVTGYRIESWLRT